MSWTIRVTDLKQYAYCPRILFYSRCLSGVRPTTFKMEEGIRAHEDASAREQRRQLRCYGLTSGERHFELWLYSIELGLSALIDLVILRPDGRDEAIPVDYKDSAVAAAHFKLQLACYGLLVEEEMGVPAPYGFLYLIPERRAVRVALTPALKRQALASLGEMRHIVDEEILPAPTDRRARCVNCEFRRFCNDVV